MKQTLHPKAQAEIIGITIVMVLIMLGIVFVITFIIVPDEVNIKKVYDVEQLGSNFLDSLLKTTTCNYHDLEDLARNCFENKEDPLLQYQCPQDNLCPDGCSACEYMNRTVEYILNRSLNSINTRYEFYICDWTAAERRCAETITLFTRNPCTDDDREREEKQTLIPTALGVRVARMVICQS